MGQGWDRDGTGRDRDGTGTVGWDGELDNMLKHGSGFLFLINFICFRCSGDQFLALLALGHAFDSNNMVVGSRGHLNTCRTLKEGFSRLNLVIDSSRGLFWVNFMGF